MGWGEEFKLELHFYEIFFTHQIFTSFCLILCSNSCPFLATNPAVLSTMFLTLDYKINIYRCAINTYYHISNTMYKMFNYLCKANLESAGYYFFARQVSNGSFSREISTWARHFCTSNLSRAQRRTI